MAQEDITIEIRESGGTGSPPPPTSGDTQRLIDDLLKQLIAAVKKSPNGGSGGGRGRPGSSNPPGSPGPLPPSKPPKTPKLPPKVPLTPSDHLQDLFDNFHFRVEGLSNLLKGGSNVRFRAIHGMSGEKLSALLNSIVGSSRAAVATGRAGMGHHAVIAASSAMSGMARATGKVTAMLVGMGPVGWAAIAGLAALTISIGLAVAAYRAASRALQAMAQDIGNMSPEISMARAQAQLSDIQSRRAAGERAGGEIAQQIGVDQEIKNLLRAIKANLIEQLYPVILAISGFVRLVLGAINGILEINRMLQTYFIDTIPGLRDLMDKVNRWLNKRKANTAKEEAARMLSQMRQSAGLDYEPRPEN